MNARERAKALIKTWRKQSVIGYEEMTSDVEQTIIAAEEEKAKAEREACAMIVHEVFEREFKMFAELKEYTDAPHCIIEEIENKIHARSEGEKKGE